ncbi:hypothetical protein LIA77_02357 [Sarocladium implicatum]|nr:hypothetical protein LIA77_02357 [Sarocladium implicatum]
MGGKTWSFDEERFFWHELIPHSPKGVNPECRTMDWDACASRMQTKMGDKARRRYTKLMLFEHYFQNVSTGHMSPHALAFVNEHKRELAAVREKSNDETPAPVSAAAFQETRLLAGRSISEASRDLQASTKWIAPNAPSDRDVRQLPRLEIPPTVADFSSMSSGSASASTTDPMALWGYQPSRLSSENPHSFQIPTFNVPYYSDGPAPMAQMSSAEPSPYLVSMVPMPSPMRTTPISWDAQWTAPVRCHKRRFDDTMGQGASPFSSKRTKHERTLGHNSLNALATAASLECTTPVSGHMDAVHPRYDSISSHSSHVSHSTSSLNPPISASQEGGDQYSVELANALDGHPNVSDAASWGF